MCRLCVDYMEVVGDVFEVFEVEFEVVLSIVGVLRKFMVWVYVGYFFKNICK